MPSLIHCTQKLLAKIPDRLIDPSASGESWHANLLRFDRRKCVLFTHDASLYSVFVPGLKKAEFEQLDELFGQRLFKALVWDEFPQTQIERMLDACRVIRCTRSNNRSVLGSMNDIQFQLGWQLEHDGGLAGVDLGHLHHGLNRTPFVAGLSLPGPYGACGDQIRSRRICPADAGEGKMILSYFAGPLPRCSRFILYSGGA